jgi:hypothetical protein
LREVEQNFISQLHALSKAHKDAYEDLRLLQNAVYDLKQQSTRALAALAPNGTMEEGFKHVYKKFDDLHRSFEQLQDVLLTSDGSGAADQKVVREVVAEGLRGYDNAWSKPKQARRQIRSPIHGRSRAAAASLRPNYALVSDRLDTIKFQETPDESAGLRALTSWLSEVVMSCVTSQAVPQFRDEQGSSPSE